MALLVQRELDVDDDLDLARQVRRDVLLDAAQEVGRQERAELGGAGLPSMSVTIFHRFPSRNLSKIVTATGR